MTATTRLSFLMFAIFGLFQTIAIAQPSVEAIAMVTNQTNTPAAKKARKKSAEIPAFYASQRAMPEVYTGLAIELTQSEVPLKRDNPLFMQFGSVVTHRTSGGMYAYNVLIAFSSEKEAERFTEVVIKPRAPQARLVAFEKGKQKKQKKAKK